jgi:hypothetical protein
MPTIKQKFKQTDQLLCAVCHALSDFCLLYNRTEFTFGSTGSRLVIPIVTVNHFYCKSGFLIPRICNIFSMLVPGQDLSKKINQDQLKNYYIHFILFQPIQNQMSCSLFMTLRSFFDPKVLFFGYDPEVLFLTRRSCFLVSPKGPVLCFRSVLSASILNERFPPFFKFLKFLVLIAINFSVFISWLINV